MFVRAYSLLVSFGLLAASFLFLPARSGVGGEATPFKRLNQASPEEG